MSRESMAISDRVRGVHAAEALEQRLMCLVREVDSVVVAHAEDRQA